MSVERSRWSERGLGAGRGPTRQAGLAAGTMDRKLEPSWQRDRAAGGAHREAVPRGDGGLCSWWAGTGVARAVSATRSIHLPASSPTHGSTPPQPHRVPQHPWHRGTQRMGSPEGPSHPTPNMYCMAADTPTLPFPTSPRSPMELAPPPSLGGGTPSPPHLPHPTAHPPRAGHSPTQTPRPARDGATGGAGVSAHGGRRHWGSGAVDVPAEGCRRAQRRQRAECAPRPFQHLHAPAGAVCSALPARGSVGPGWTCSGDEAPSMLKARAEGGSAGALSPVSGSVT